MSKKILIALLSIANFTNSAVSYAQGGATGGGNISLIDPLGNKNFQDLANSIIDFIFTISIPLVAILVLWGGFQMVTAAGKPEQFSAGKKTILYTAIGFAVILFAKGIVATIRGFLGV